jgi:hemerythrin
MTLIQWNGDLSVNVTEIDAQHRHLIGLINDLNEAMREGRGKRIVGEIIDGLVAYTATHFATEEEYLRRHGYPGADDHAREHREFNVRVAGFRKGFEEGRLGLTVSVMNFLGVWLRDHILGSDKKYAAVLNAPGTQPGV